MALLLCGARWCRFKPLESLEARTYDWRVRIATNFPSPYADNLGLVAISDESVTRLNDGSLGYHYAVPWPRHIYGQILRELSRQEAGMVGFDILFAEPHPTDSPVLVDHVANPDLEAFLAQAHPGESPVKIDDLTSVESDDFFAWQLQLASNAVLATDAELLPAELFRNSAVAEGDISAEKDSDGILRRAKAVTTNGVWQLGLVLAARELGLDLDHAEKDFTHGRIILRGSNGLERVIPVDVDGSFYIDWSLTANDSRLSVEPIENLLAADQWHTAGQAYQSDVAWRNKLVFIGSTATGNNLTDLGATPLQKETYLVSKHWNIANSLIVNRFIRRSSLLFDCLIIGLLCALSTAFTLRFRTLTSTVTLLVCATAYTAVAVALYVQHRLWLPIVLPVAGALFLTYVCLLVWRVLFEQTEKRRIRYVFAKIVAPEVVQELLEAENVSLGGTRREVTVLFADVRGFTAFTDASRENAVKIAQEKNLSGPAAEDHFEREARETLATVNSYLALVADKVKAHRGTLDKYIGDCAMAFWNAPTPLPQHALACVHAAIDTQRAINTLNRQRADENSRRELENLRRAASGQPPLPLLPILSLGTGINTGEAIFGLMGSEEHGLNYTVFGREVNLASRLESLSGRGRILIGGNTFAALQRDDSALAETCSALPPVNLKGIREAVKVYEVPWRLPGDIAPIGDDYGSAAETATAFTPKNP